jgi:site-specific recombinase XerD
MMDKNALMDLYRQGILSQAEYDKIVDRMKINNSKDEIAIKPVLKDFQSFLLDDYSNNTVDAYISNAKDFVEFITQQNIKYMSNDTKLPNISGKDIQAWFNRLLSTGYNPTSIRRAKYSVRKFLLYINNNYGISIPEIDSIDVPKSAELSDIDVLIDEEIRSIADHALSIRDKAIILFSYETGMRRQELLDCEKLHINFDNCSVKIYTNGKFDRVGYFSNSVKDLLLLHIKTWRNEIADINYNRRLKSNFFTLLEESEYLFQTVKSPKMSYATIFKAIKDASMEYYLNLYAKEGYCDAEAKDIAEEQVNKVNTETLRHSRRAYYFSEGRTVEQVQILMGDENTWVCKRYLKIAQQLYPEKFI